MTVDPEKLLSIDPVHAVSSGDLEALSLLLLSRDPRLNEFDGKGRLPVCYAVFSENTSVLKLFKDHGWDIDSPCCDSGDNILSLACQNRSSEHFIRSILDMGSDPNVSGADGWTPLMWCVLKDSGVAARLLVSYGSSIHSRNDNNETLFDIAREMGRYSLGNDIEAHFLKRTIHGDRLLDYLARA